jgi:CubicO group peptidase (beta-lactamase class C family)
LDQVIQNATGITLNAYVYTRIQTKTGMNGFYSNTGYNNVYYSKARSMARFGLLLLNKGVWNTTPVLSDTAFFNQMTNTSQSLNLSYGYLTWLNGKSSFMVPQLQLVFPGKLMPNAPDDAFFALGKNGQFISVYPAQKVVFIRMGNAPTSAPVPFALNDSICRRLNEVMCSPTHQNSGLIEENTQIQVYPNPASDRVYLNLPFEHIQRIEIIDLSGKIIATEYKNNQILVQKLSQGLYFLKCYTNKNTVYISRFLKQNP